METSEILNASALEIIFAGRNKEYGAYQLRYHYVDRMRLSMIIVGCLVLVGSLLFFLLRGRAQPAVQLLNATPVKLTAYHKPKEPEKKKVVLQRMEQPKKVEMHRLALPKITPDKLVTHEDVPPKQTDRIVVGPVTQHGAENNGSLTAPPEVKGVSGNGKGLSAGASTEGDYLKDVFINVQVEAMYPGGPTAWKKFLERNLRQQTPIENGATSGLYAVVVSFIVARDGSTSEIKILSAPSPDYGTAEEAKRVIERSGRWNPAIQNGRQVAYRAKQKIIFQVE